MIHAKFIFISLVSLVLFCGCGLQETVIQKEQVSYLAFTGNISNAIIHIDDLEPFALKDNKNGKKTHYEISDGKHHITVLKNGIELVNRTILLGSGSLKEIKIP